MSWFGTVEFYVIAGTVAAAVIALSALPARRGAAQLHMAAGRLEEPDALDDPERPRLDVEVTPRGTVRITRRGLKGIGSDGAVSLAATVIGFDVKIEERLTPGRTGAQEPGHAVFDLDFFAPERYHISYNSDDAGLFAAFTLAVRPGLRLSRPLR